MADKNNYSIEEIEKKIKFFNEFGDAKGAYFYRKDLENFIEKENFKEINPPLYRQYAHESIKLKFLSLNFIDDWDEMMEFIKNNFNVIYEIENYNLWEKIKVNLSAISNGDVLNEIKEKFKKSLLECPQIIINKKRYVNYQNIPFSVADWLKDYNKNLGISKIDSLKRSQYLTNSENIKKLNDNDKNKLKILFDFYEKIKISSNAPEGYLKTSPIYVNNKFVNFSEGEVTEITPDILNIVKSIKISEENINKEENSDKLSELRAMAGQYPAGSLERKAVEEEMRKLESLKF